MGLRRSSLGESTQQSVIVVDCKSLASFFVHERGILDLMSLAPSFSLKLVQSRYAFPVFFVCPAQRHLTVLVLLALIRELDLVCLLSLGSAMRVQRMIAVQNSVRLLPKG